jgi:hypothetical protein
VDTLCGAAHAVAGQTRGSPAQLAGGGNGAIVVVTAKEPGDEHQARVQA